VPKLEKKTLLSHTHTYRHTSKLSSEEAGPYGGRGREGGEGLRGRGRERVKVRREKAVEVGRIIALGERSGSANF